MCLDVGFFKLILSGICEPIPHIDSDIFPVWKYFLQYTYYHFYFYCSGFFLSSAIILKLDSHSLSQYLSLFSVILLSFLIQCSSPIDPSRSLKINLQIIIPFSTLSVFLISTFIIELSSLIAFFDIHSSLISLHISSC